MLDDGGTRIQSRGLCIALCGPDHRIIDGSVGGVLTIVRTVQVMAGFCVIENFLTDIILNFLRLCWCSTIEIRCIHSILLNLEVLYSY